MSSIILGPGLIGEAASKKAQQTAVDDAGGGAIQLGGGIVNDKFKKRKLAAAGQASSLPPAVRAAVDTAPAQVPIAEVNLGAPDASAPGLSEDDVEVLLATDPNAWDLVIEAEGKRAEGWRPRVAGMLLLAAPEAKAKPVPEEIVTELQRIAHIAIVADAEKLKASVDAAPTIGTGDPDAVAVAKPASKTSRRIFG